MFSLAGVPPLFGFFAKLMVLKAAIDAGAALARDRRASCSRSSALFYYLRVVKVMYFDEPPTPRRCRSRTISRSAGRLSLNGIALLVLGLLWGPLYRLVPARAFGVSTTHSGNESVDAGLQYSSMQSPIMRSSGAGWSSLAARRAHNPKVAGSNPAPATNSRNKLPPRRRPRRTSFAPVHLNRCKHAAQFAASRCRPGACRTGIAADAFAPAAAANTLSCDSRPCQARTYARWRRTVPSNPAP